MCKMIIQAPIYLHLTHFFNKNLPSLWDGVGYPFSNKPNKRGSQEGSRAPGSEKKVDGVCRWLTRFKTFRNLVSAGGFWSLEIVI